MNGPRVATLMAVYGGERPSRLKASVDSLLAQTYEHLEVHIFRDGPLPAELGHLLGSYEGGVTLHEHPSRRGLAACLNDLVTELRGRYPYFARMDSDDVSFPDRISKQVAFLEAHPSVDVCGGAIVDMDQEGNPLKQVAYPESHAEIVRFFRKRNPIAHVSVVYRTSYFDKAGLYPPMPALEDGLYWMQGFRGGCVFHNLPDPLVYVRRTDDFLRRRSGPRKAAQELKIKLTINRELGFGPSSYGWALATFVFQLLPVSLKQRLYDRLR